MMKRKCADRADWQRVTKKRFAMMHMDRYEFKGFVTIFCIDAVREPLWKTLSGERVCLADVGYVWTQHFPQGQHYAITSVFDEQGEFVRGYIDICKSHFLNERGVPCYDDLYLDLDVSPVGEVALLDVDELDTALQEDAITGLEYELAWREANSLTTAIEADAFPLLWLSLMHKAELLSLV